MDARWFSQINGATHPALDRLMPWITQIDHFIVPLSILWLVLFWRADRRGRVVLIGVLVALGLSDLVSSHLVKPLVDRLRPCHVIAPVNLYQFSCKQSPAFPSSHAANLACVAVVLGWRYRWTIPITAVLALVVGYSRVYVGVHYPLDVLGGYAIGLIVGFLSILMIRAAIRRIGWARDAETGPDQR